jgi:hypothetical protein
VRFPLTTGSGFGFALIDGTYQAATLSILFTPKKDFITHMLAFTARSDIKCRET